MTDPRTILSKSNMRKPMSLLGFLTEHGWVATHRNMGDFKTATPPEDLTPVWITTVQDGMNRVPHLPPMVSCTLALPKATRSCFIKDTGHNYIRLAGRGGGGAGISGRGSVAL